MCFNASNNLSLSSVVTARVKLCKRCTTYWFFKGLGTGYLMHWDRGELGSRDMGGQSFRYILSLECLWNWPGICSRIFCMVVNIISRSRPRVIYTPPPIDNGPVSHLFLAFFSFLLYISSKLWYMYVTKH